MRAISNSLRSPAMIVACAALIVALGGVSYAAGVLPKNAVGTAQLQKRAVTASKLHKNAVNAAKVKDGSLQAADFKAGQLPSGPRGSQGPQGPQGVQGVPGPSVQAYAQVDRTGPAPVLISERTKNFTSVTRVDGGRYCLTPAAGIDPNKVAAVVSPEHGHSAGSDLTAYMEQPQSICAANQFEVFTEQAGVASNNVAFTIIVP